MMINQMMLLMHLEAQLREQAVVAYSRAEDPLPDSSVRVQRLDDVVALNEQLNEVGTMLSLPLSAPLYRPQRTNVVPVAAVAQTSNPTGIISLLQSKIIIPFLIYIY